MSRDKNLLDKKYFLARDKNLSLFKRPMAEPLDQAGTAAPRTNSLRRHHTVWPGWSGTFSEKKYANYKRYLEYFLSAIIYFYGT